MHIQKDVNKKEPVFAFFSQKHRPAKKRGGVLRVSNTGKLVVPFDFTSKFFDIAGGGILTTKTK